jgi:hypothetical protein
MEYILDFHEMKAWIMLVGLNGMEDSQSCVESDDSSIELFCLQLYMFRLTEKAGNRS